LPEYGHGKLKAEERMHRVWLPADSPPGPETIQGKGKQRLDDHDGSCKKLVQFSQGENATA